MGCLEHSTYQTTHLKKIVKLSISGTPKVVEALFGALERSRLASWHPKVFHTACLDGLHGYIVCWPTYWLQGQCWGPKMGYVMA